jgi:alkylhydroperoxidase family enzyme
MSYEPDYDACEPLFKRTPFEQLDADNQAMWKLAHSLTGQATQIEVLAQHPVLDRFYLKEFYPRFFYNSQGEMLVDHKDKELFRYRIGRKNGCVVCSRGNYQTMLDAGYSEAQVANILDATSEHFSERELTLIEFADMFVLGNMETLSRDLHTRLRKFYSDAQILEMGMVAAFFMGYQRILFGFDLAPHEKNGVCSIDSVAAE